MMNFHNKYGNAKKIDLRNKSYEQFLVKTETRIARVLFYFILSIENF